ncbi:uncharacterized protein SPPG_07653 [Spizellomyces punctatus DAOM BR117]|uniref:Uncharacterized protein n=1 Tax=Spizellomyces punctatus (strain DAOM BR117) TaxID=645134 RepID=A0A0L0H8L8_SPIPD|nr:uncharacterized protein SPPG_07653 [Spizellomyces punctatus DAOM BR117]KNC97264.1 hypothetical protein SPPG_07653 [Spizellomyces punctatus DAOM BR117]|eukprot:XP_016605304.1 hypothetical protein SPPG_07653 [Spizellomyces punctatus DAOM BR117]
MRNYLPPQPVIEDFVEKNPDAGWEDWVARIEELLAGFPETRLARQQKHYLQLANLKGSLRVGSFAVCTSRRLGVTPGSVLLLQMCTSLPVKQELSQLSYPGLKPSQCHNGTMMQKIHQIWLGVKSPLRGIQPPPMKRELSQLGYLASEAHQTLVKIVDKPDNQCSLDSHKRKKARLLLEEDTAGPEPTGLEEEFVPLEEITVLQEGSVPPEEIAGLQEVLKGANLKLEHDVIVANINCSQLIRQVLSDVLLDMQKPEGDQKFNQSVLMTVPHVDAYTVYSTLKGGILVTRHLPEPYEKYLDTRNWAKLYHSIAHETLWDAVAAVAPPAIAAATHKFEIRKLVEEETEDSPDDMTFSELARDEAIPLEAIYPYVGADAPAFEHEPSYTGKYVTPHFSRLLSPRWKLYIDTVMNDRKHPDITIKTMDRIVLVAELKSPHATSTQRNLQLADGLERAMKLVKKDMLEYDWGQTPLQLITAIAPDGAVFHIYNVQIYEGLCFCVELGKIPIVNSLENVGNLPRCIAGFRRLKEILKASGERLCSQRARHTFQDAPNYPITPDKHGLLRDLRQVFPDALTPETKTKEKRRRSQG